ncbi:MAG: hypothetical protein ACI83I_000217, partial [Bacteroidia bacterium]
YRGKPRTDNEDYAALLKSKFLISTWQQQSTS